MEGLAAARVGLTERQTTANDTVSGGERRHWIRSIAYWAATIFVTLELVAGSIWAMFQIEFNQAQLRHLGYPSYFDLIVGPWKLAGAAALVAPRFPRLKEWAYAGFFFNCYAAAASHLFRGDGPWTWGYPLVLIALTFVSWALRPADRQLHDAKPSSDLRPIEWAIPVAIIFTLFVLSCLTIPKGRGGF